MRAIRVIPVLLVAACLGAGIASVPESTISGAIVDAAGRPVPGARVALIPMGLFDPSGSKFAQVDSGADGSFRFEDVPVGRYGVTATASRHTAARVADVEAGRSGLRLQLTAGGPLWSGRVTDRTGRPRSGAEVRVVRGLGESGDVFLVVSGLDGRWGASLPLGSYSANAVFGNELAAAPRIQQARNPVIDLVLDPVGPAGPPPPAVVGWMRERRIPLSTVEPGRGFGDLAPLRAIVGDARVVGLGEATHGTREIFLLKHRLLEYLVSELGFDMLAIETGLAESFAIEDYVHGGPGDPAQLLAAESAVWKTEELRDVIRWMREWNRTHTRQVHFQGLDMRRGGVAAGNVLAYLEKTDRAALSEPFVRALAPVADPAIEPEIRRRPSPELAALAGQAHELAAWLESRRAQLVAKSSEEAWWRAAMQARVLVQMFGWLAAPDIHGRVLVRESAMADNALQALDRAGRSARAVVWAHNAHVAGDRNAEPPMMGSHLRNRLGRNYCAIGSVLERGSYQAWDSQVNGLNVFEIAAAAPGSLENTIAAAAWPIAILDLRSLPPTGVVTDWFHAFQAMRQFDGLYDDQRPAGWGSTRAVVTRDYDALMFVGSGTVARKLPATPAR